MGDVVKLRRPPPAAARRFALDPNDPYWLAQALNMVPCEDYALPARGGSPRKPKEEENP